MSSRSSSVSGTPSLQQGVRNDRVDRINLIPKFVLLKIFDTVRQSVGVESFIANVSAVSKRWNDLARDPLIWTAEVESGAAIVEKMESPSPKIRFTDIRKQLSLRQIYELGKAFFCIETQDFVYNQEGDIPSMIFNTSGPFRSCNIADAHTELSVIFKRICCFSLLEGFMDSTQALKDKQYRCIDDLKIKGRNMLEKLFEHLHHNFLDIPDEQMITFTVTNHKCQDVWTCQRHYLIEQDKTFKSLKLEVDFLYHKYKIN